MMLANPMVLAIVAIGAARIWAIVFELGQDQRVRRVGRYRPRLPPPAGMARTSRRLLACWR
jgi:hypothetical protein